MVGSSENIFVDFDYNNIIIVDPNKVVDEKGVVKERNVKQEDLVMYANLECKMYPRTKLALGVAANDSVQTISIATINFLKNGTDEYLTNKYTDEITGKGSLQGKGINQANRNTIKNPNQPDDYYIKQTMMSNGNIGATDTGMLGITRINIRQGLDFTPVFDITLEDVKGRGLFESGNNSPYAAFFNFPYPMFELTLKGYYGKAIKYRLMLKTFNARYESSTGNFVVDLKFFTYKFTVGAEILMGYLLATPYMYKSSYSVKNRIGSPANLTPVDNVTTYLGFEKIKEVYNEYKSKGILPDNFPNLTIGKLKNNLENFIKNILDTYTKQNLDPLTDIETYENQLLELRKKVYMNRKTSWFETYMDLENYLVLKNPNNGNLRSVVPARTDALLNKFNVTKDNSKNTDIFVYTFKPTIKTPSDRQNARDQLKQIVEEYTNLLKSNPTLGESGKYVVNKKTTNSTVSIPNDFKYKIFEISVTKTDVDLDKTYQVLNKTKKQLDDDEREKFAAELETKGILKNSLNSTLTLKDGSSEPVNEYFYYEGLNSFSDRLDKIETDAKNWRKQIEDDLSKALAEVLQSNDKGIGFEPTIRNVLAIIFANAEGFMRMLDDVHTKAWEVRTDSDRLEAVLNSSVSSASPDNLTPGLVNDSIVYPWPTFLTTTLGQDGHEKFEPRYPGDNDVIKFTKGYKYETWPEIEFVEEYTKGLTERGKSDDNPPFPATNQITDIKRISLNAIEFPVNNEVFYNKEEVKFMYEIYERIMFIATSSRLSKLGKNIVDINVISNIISESETINIKESLSNDNPFLIKKLVSYSVSSNNFLNILRHISNQGVGVSWQNYIRGIYNTTYIKELYEDNNFSFLDESVIVSPLSKPLVSLNDETKFNELLVSGTTSNNIDLLDLQPFIDITWVKNKIPDGYLISEIKDVFNTTKTISFDTKLKTLTNFNTQEFLQPITNFVHKGEFTIPKPEDEPQLSEFYKNRKPNKQLITEGDLTYINYSGNVSANQTISMLNTPYFVNSIQEGVKNFRNYEKYPYVSAAYLFLNSLPLTTFKEKYKVYNTGFVSELDYIFTAIKKFGAVHKLPYAWIVKIGSIWHRYKRYVNDNVDILSNVWKNFDYVENFDPVTTAATKNYTLTIDGGTVDIVLQKNATFGTETSTLINTGFYPKLINDFNVFHQGFEIFSGYTNAIMQDAIDKYKVNLKFVPESLISVNKGQIKTDVNRDIRVIPWSVYVNTADKQFSYIFPSMGSIMNQAQNECFKSGSMIVELSGNTSLFNGTVRNFWALPTYGYFDNTRVFKSNPRQYLKELKLGKPENEQKVYQPNFSIQGNITKYADIGEMFSIFEKDILDLFEEKFLNFSKSRYDIDNDVDYGLNFQKLMNEMMKIPSTTGTTSTEIIEKYQERQLGNINQVLNDFLDKKQYIKYGNPSNYERKLFATFSNYEITDPYVWEKYTVKTPNALPYLGGAKTLSQSKLEYPNEWKALETYIGFSEIDKLVYSNNGSYFTDFFIDLNVAFTVDNIKNYSPIIKIYATQKLRDYIDKALLPNSTPNINSNAILKDGNIIELIPVNNSYVTPVLFNQNKEVIFSAKKSILFGKNPEKRLFEDVILSYYGPFGLQENPIVTTYIKPSGLKSVPDYKSNFSEKNFKKAMDKYIDKISGFQDKIINNLMLRLQFALPSVVDTPEKISEPTLIKSTLGKLEYWEAFKALNDKWIAGYDFKNKTLFEDVLLLDRASRNIGDKILVDIFELKERLDTLYRSGANTNLLAFITAILQQNNFTVLNLPSYVNFYNVQDATKNSTPKPEKSLDFANTLFGTFMNVDTRESSAKLVCTFAGKPSEHLAVKHVDYKFRDDSFDIRKPDNPIVEDQTNKTDWDKSNKVVGFNVEIGPQNQSIFYNFSVSQDASSPTAESLEVNLMMANQGNGKSTATQTVSLYNMYRNRSYNCTLSLMGNALIQPSMYFNLRYVPMFSGPYMITQVNHTISAGVFDTTIEGKRQPTANIQVTDSYLQSIKTNLLKTIVAKQKQKKDQDSKFVSNSTGNTNQQRQNNLTAASSMSSELAEPTDCVKLLDKKYEKYTPVDSPTEITATAKDVVTKIFAKMAEKNISDDGKLKYAVFSSLYMTSYGVNNFKAYENNFSGVVLSKTWMNLPSTSTQYFCLKKDNLTLLPYATFTNINQNIDFLVSRYKDRMRDVDTKNLPSSLAKFWVLNRENSIPNTDYTTLSTSDLSRLENKVANSIKLFDSIKIGING